MYSKCFQHPFQHSFENLDLDLDLQSELHPAQDQDLHVHMNFFRLTWMNLKNGNDKNQTNTKKCLTSLVNTWLV